MRMPSRVQRITSLSVSSIVTGDGGYWKYASPSSMWAVGSPSVTMITCLVPDLAGEHACRASSSACCMFVPHSKSQLISGSSSGFTSRATRPKLTRPK